MHAKLADAAVQIAPLNGTRTHPLSAHARDELADIASHPLPRNAVNPGCANRLLREALVESVQDVSPYPTHKGKQIEFLRITDAGRAVLAKS